MKSVCLPKETGWEKPNTPGMEGPDLGEISPFLQVPPSNGEHPWPDGNGWVGQGHPEPPWGAALGHWALSDRGDLKRSLSALILIQHSHNPTHHTPPLAPLMCSGCSDLTHTDPELTLHWIPANVPPVKPPQLPLPADSTHFRMWCSQALTHSHFFFPRWLRQGSLVG